MIINITTTDLQAEPVAVTEAKLSMKVAFNDDDLLIQSLITTARKWLENYTGLSFGVKTITTVVDLCADEVWTVINGPVRTMTTVGFQSATSSDIETLETDEYVLTGDVFQPYFTGRYTLTYSAGYTSLPEDLKTDIKRLVGWMYQNRGINLSNEATSNVDFPRLNAEFYKRVVI